MLRLTANLLHIALVPALPATFIEFEIPIPRPVTAPKPTFLVLVNAERVWEVKIPRLYHEVAKSALQFCTKL